MRKLLSTDLVNTNNEYHGLMATVSVVLFGISSLFLHNLLEDLSNVRQFRMRL